jgi:uncharacterized membrane protein
MAASERRPASGEDLTPRARALRESLERVVRASHESPNRVAERFGLWVFVVGAPLAMLLWVVGIIWLLTLVL